MTTSGTVTARKARRGGHDGTCMETAEWRKASRSGQQGNCVEITVVRQQILIRDSKYLRNPENDPKLQPIIRITAAQWGMLLDAVAGRSAATTEPRVAVHMDGAATLIAANGTTLDYTPDEWQAFTLSAIDGEFDELAEMRQAPVTDLVTA